MTIKHGTIKTIALLLAVVSSVRLHASGPVPLTVITTAQISGALRQSGLNVSADHVEPLASVPAKQANPRLTVASIEPLDKNSAKARIRCDRVSICLPFYVLVHWQEANAVKTAINEFQTGARQTGRHLQPEDVLVHQGKEATLVFQGAHLRMTLPVTCLQNGGRGQRVRVISKDRKKIYLAQVIAAGMLTSAGVN